MRDAHGGNPLMLAHRVGKIVRHLTDKEKALFFLDLRADRFVNEFGDVQRREVRGDVGTSARANDHASGVFVP